MYDTDKSTFKIKGAICKNWPPVEFIIERNGGWHMTRIKLIAANCSCRQLVSTVSRAGSKLGSSGGYWCGMVASNWEHA